MFQIDVSSPLGVDISIFPPWTTDKGGLRGDIYTHSAPPGGDNVVQQPPSKASVWLCPALLAGRGGLCLPPARGSGLPLWLCPEGWPSGAGASQNRWVNRAKVTGWWFSGLFLFTKICSAFYSALEQEEVNSVHLCCKMRIRQEMK